MIIAFNPPSLDTTGVRNFQELRDAVLGFFPRYVQYTNDYFQTQLLPPLNSGVFGFGNDIASAATINITNYIHQVTGAVAVATINVPTGFSGSVVLYARDGFSVTSAGNITPAASIAAGHGILLAYHAGISKWVGITS